MTRWLRCLIDRVRAWWTIDEPIEAPDPYLQLREPEDGLPPQDNVARATDSLAIADAFIASGGALPRRPDPDTDYSAVVRAAERILIENELP